MLQINLFHKDASMKLKPLKSDYWILLGLEQKTPPFK